MHWRFWSRSVLSISTWRSLMHHLPLPAACGAPPSSVSVSPHDESCSAWPSAYEPQPGHWRCVWGSSHRLILKVQPEFSVSDGLMSQLTPVAWLLGSLPSSCGYAPSALACSWTHFPSLEDRADDTFKPNHNVSTVSTPVHSKISSLNTHRWLSIFLDSLYLRSSRLNVLILLIQITFSGRRALAVPLRLPYPNTCIPALVTDINYSYYIHDQPECLPFLLASRALLTRDLEWMVVGFLMIKPSLTNFLTFCLELALLISVVSLGSSQILRLPHFSTEAASLFCSRRVLKYLIIVVKYS